MSEQDKEPLMITPGGGAFPFAVVGEIEQAEQAPVGYLCEDSFGRGQVFWFNKPADNTPLYAAPQPVQEPVTWMDLHKELGKLRWMGGDEGWDNAINAVRDRLIELATPHPVRTKDLTDDEVAKAYMECTGGDIITRCRAVIAADREKNK